MGNALIGISPLLLGYILDLAFGDPYNLPHPVRLFGNLISFSESRLNRGKAQFIKGSLVAVFLVAGTFIIFYFVMALLKDLHVLPYVLVAGIFVFYGIANRSLIDEGRKVFAELQEKGIEAGRKRLSWIVGRDTSNLSAQQIRVAVFETMSITCCLVSPE
jgi:adenosylcobinamide-phosphate synthase